MIVRCARIVPARRAGWFGEVLGHWFAYWPGRDQGRARAHLRLAFPDAGRDWIERAARRCFRHFGGMGLWSLCSLHHDPRGILAGSPAEGPANMRAAWRACLRRRGTLILSGHLGNWELLARCAGSIMPATILGRRLRYPELDELIREWRGVGGNRLIDQDAGLRPCLRELREGRLMATLPDQDVGRLAGVFVPFFGRPAYTPIGPAMLAVLARVPMQSVFCYRRAGRWVFHWGPRIAPPASGDRERDAAILTATAMAYQERFMRARGLEQWVWWHKRWRHAPADRPEAPVVERRDGRWVVRIGDGSA